MSILGLLPQAGTEFPASLYTNPRRLNRHHEHANTRITALTSTSQHCTAHHTRSQHFTAQPFPRQEPPLVRPVRSSSRRSPHLTGSGAVVAAAAAVAPPRPWSRAETTTSEPRRRTRGSRSPSPALMNEGCASASLITHGRERATEVAHKRRTPDTPPSSLPPPPSHAAALGLRGDGESRAAANWSNNTKAFEAPGPCRRRREIGSDGERRRQRGRDKKRPKERSHELTQMIKSGGREEEERRGKIDPKKGWSKKSNEETGEVKGSKKREESDEKRR